MSECLLCLLTLVFAELTKSLMCAFGCLCERLDADVFAMVCVSAAADVFMCVCVCVFVCVHMWMCVCVWM